MSRGKTLRVEPTERKKIVDLLHEHGGNQNRVARICGRSQDTVRRIALAEGIQSVNRAPKKALEVKAAVEEIDRMEVIALGLSTGTELLRGYKDRKATLENIRAYKDLMTGIAIGIDKHRLETGEATSREERWNGDARERHFGKLFAQLDAYRAGVDDGDGSRNRSLSVDTNGTHNPTA